jgi:hypothetical protein
LQSNGKTPGNPILLATLPREAPVFMGTPVNSLI